VPKVISKRSSRSEADHQILKRTMTLFADRSLALVDERACGRHVR